MTAKQFVFPDDLTLAKYLALLRAIILQARFLAQQGNATLAADLLDAIENVPDLLARWPETDEWAIWAQLDELAKSEETRGLAAELQQIRQGDFSGILHPPRRS